MTLCTFECVFSAFDAYVLCFFHVCFTFLIFTVASMMGSVHFLSSCHI